MSEFFRTARRVAIRLGTLALVAIVTVAGASGDARALNVPGSVAGGFVIDTVFYAVEDAGSLAQNGGGFNVSGDGRQLASISPQAGSQFDGFIAGGQGTKWGISATVDYRHLDLDANNVDLDYDIFVGSIAVGYALDNQVTLIGGAIVEVGDGSSQFNAGGISGVGFGGFAGATYSVDQNWTLTGLLGYQRLNFDVDRASNTITGDFNADRFFIAAEADYRDQDGPWIWRVGGGARYIHQDSDAYQEIGAGGVFVPSITEDVLSLTARGKVGYMMANGITPFTELDVSYDVVSDATTTTGIATLSESFSDWSVRPMAGVEWTGSENFRLLAQGGPIFSGDGYDGLTVRLNAQIRF